MAKANNFYLANNALWFDDHSWNGFEWLDNTDKNNSVFLFQRKGKTGSDKVIVALNMVPVPLQQYKIPVDEPGKYRISLNTDDMSFGGSGYPTGANEKGVFIAEEGQWKGRQFYISICLPPLSGMYIEKLSEPGTVTVIDTKMDTVTGKDLLKND